MQMRRMILAAAAVLSLAAGTALAADENYNTGAASTANSTTANCQSALMRDACAAAALTEAPLPLAGAGMLGALLLGGAGLTTVVLRRRNG
jgi:hypothetical protein